MEWNVRDKSPVLDVAASGRVRYVSSMLDHMEAASIKTQQPLDPSCGIFYFEISVISGGSKGFVDLTTTLALKEAAG
jgi:hypothetical protein